MTGANETTWAPDELDRIGVSFADAAPQVQGDIDAAYHAKYHRYGPRIVGSVTGPDAHRVTVRLVPQAEKEQV